MRKTRQKRPGPKSSKKKTDESSEEPDEVEKDDSTKETSDEPTEKDAPKVSSPKEDESGKDSTAKEAEDCEKSLEDDDETEKEKEKAPEDEGDDEDLLVEVQPKVPDQDKAPEDEGDDEDLLVEVQPKVPEQDKAPEVNGDKDDLPADVQEKENEGEKPKLGLRLVPLSSLLKPEVLVKPKPAEVKPKQTRKSSHIARKSVSYIEISSDSDSDSGSDSSVAITKNSSRHSRDGSTKENNSTNNKLSNGNSKKTNFKEPGGSSHLLKNSKNFSVNVEKMPQNVNRLMKCYRVDGENSRRIESLSDADDFENMITTSKIDRMAPDKSKTPPEETVAEPAKVAEPKTKKPQKKRKESSSDDEVVIKTNKKKAMAESAPKRPERMSARNAKLRTKTVIESDEASTENSGSDEEEVPPKKSRTSRKDEPVSTKLSESKKKKATRSESSGSEKLFKKKISKDDHASEKQAKVRRPRSSSSEEEDKPLPVRGARKKAKESPPGKSSKTKPEPVKETRSSPRKGKTKNRKISESESSKNEKSESESLKSSSDNDEVVKKAECDREKLKESRQPSPENDTEVESAKEASPEPAESEASATSKDDKPQILDLKLRTRNKFEANSAFQNLKKTIEQRKSKKLKPSAEKIPAKNMRNGIKPKEIAETNNNHEDESDDVNKAEETEQSIAKSKSKKAGPTRKRLLSSSEEEQENGETETPIKKKKKMSSTEDTDFDPESGEEKVENDSDEEEEDEKPKESSSSDDDDDQPKKRKVQKNSDSEDDVDDLEKDRPKDKRRKRIKKVDSSDEDGENGDKSKGRKNIRKMMKADKLDVSTKEAAKIERDRKQRIEERQKMYNQDFDERPEEAKEISQLVLDFDEETKKPLLEVDKKLAKKLKPHQANGVKFMWDACFESLDRCETDSGSGCILAHCMGLGKTLQVVTLVHTLLKNTDETGVTRILVVCPLSTVLNWKNEFNIWLKDLKGFEDIYVYEINKLKQNIDRANKLMEWHNDGGIMILSYDMFRNLSNDQGSRFRKKIKDSLQTSLLDPGPDLVVCDEGHLLKNEKTSISKAMMRLRTRRRIVLTGTPLQNNLKEYYCMVQFVKPNLLGKYQEYLNRFVNPITNGQYTDSTEYDIQIMRRRAHVLHKLLDGCVQRRDYSVLAPFLLPKHEYVLSIKLTPMQVKLYKYYMENKSRSNDENGGRKGSILFQDFQNLQRIWTAPLVLRYNSNRYELEMQRRKDLESEDESEGSLKDFIDDTDSGESTPASSSSDGGSDDDGASIQSDEKKKKKKKKGVSLPRRTRAKAAELPSDHEEEEVAAVATKTENPTEWWMQICPEEELNNLEHSSKLMLLFSILEECEAIGDKLLVFSQSLYSLDVIEHFLNHIDEQTQKNAACASFTGSWTQGLDYFRLDGSTPVEQRNLACKHFNSKANPRARLFLISTRAGGLGINLVAANRVIIFDVSWNPSHDIQSIFRVYRFGQTKPCYIYRFLALGTMEEKIYERQVTKQAISKRVIDEQQIDRHYNQNDLQELYNFDLEPDDERILPILPKDRLFAEMLRKFEDTIYKYHEHDTLLENKEEETLGEEERRQAWEEFEAEKTRPQFVSYVPQQPRGIGPVTSNNIFGIRTDVLLKLLSMKARLDNPSISDGSVKQAIPLLMQELYRQMDRGELTLYQQLLALSSSLEVPQNYGGQFRVNENMMQQTYNSLNALPSTSSAQPTNAMMYQQQLAERQQQFLRLAQQQQMRQQQQMLAAQQQMPMKRKSPPRIIGSVIEID